ncbi:MAG: DUF6265 family protein [Bacteroidia bacterium]|nr:DUF6265 family protein [Bacteroidia bacterium]
MENMRFLMSFCLLLALFAASSCKKQKQKNDLSWLVGTWEMKSRKGSTYEKWEQTSKNELLGRSFKIMEGDTLLLESIQIQVEDDQLYFIPTVPTQNEGKAIRFKNTKLEKGMMIFENPEHDFPQIISYSLINPDSIHAEVAGEIDGKLEKRSFPMKRIN